MKTIFFFVADHLLVGQLCTNPMSDRSLLSCLKVTMFNERDRRCAAVQLMLSTDSSYDNRTIASTLKMQIRTVQRLRVQLNATDDHLEVVERRFQVRATSCHLTSSAWKSTPKCTWMCWRVWWSAGAIRWPVADSRCGSRKTQAWLQKECYDFVPFSYWPPSSPDLNRLDYFVWSYVENITNMTSHNTKASLIAAIGRVFAELPPVLVEKACSQFGIRIEAVIEAEGGYIE